MQQPESQVLSASAASSSNVPSVDDLKARIPLLQKMKQDDPRFGTLIHLLQEASSKPYDPSQKYLLMFKVIEIGNLFEVLCADIENKKPAEIVKTCGNGVALNSLKLDQQLSLFQLARSASADYFHAMYEDQTVAFSEVFTSLCKGQCTSTKLLEIDDTFQTLSRGTSVKKIFVEPRSGKESINKLFCQMGYYLKKADEFLKLGNREAAAMALIAAGNCGRDFNRSSLNPIKDGSVTAALLFRRTQLAHIYVDSKVKATLYDILVSEAKQEQIYHQINQVKEEATKMGNPVDIDAYYSKKESSAGSSSPKAYNKEVLRKPSAATANKLSSTSMSNPSPLLTPSIQLSSSRTVDSLKERDEPKRREKERHSSSSYASAMPSSISNYSDRRSYDDPRSDRERGRDRERGHDYRRDDRRSDDRRHGSPPRSSYGSSSSGSKHDEQYDRRASSSARTESLDRSRESQPSRALNEEEERHLRDKKRTREPSESCRDDAHRTSRKDDSDDESRRHEKRTAPQQPGLGSSGSISSTQKSSTLSGGTGFGTYMGSSSHSDVQHESSSLSASYASGLGRSKDWRSVEIPGRRDPQPEKPVVTEHSQQVRTKRELPQIEAETSKEEQSSPKRRF